MVHVARPIASMLVLVALVGCGSGASNKAGATKAKTILRLADSDNSDQPSIAAVEHFAAQVKRESGGSLTVEITFEAAGKSAPRVESNTIRLVESGRYDLGVVGARAWDLQGDTSFRAIQAPFLIDSENLLDRVLNSPIADAMLRSLDKQGVVGLGLVPEYLRHPIGIRRPLVRLDDYRGARIRVLPSRTSAAVIRSLGAIPVEISNDQIGTAMALGHVNGEELPLRTAPDGSVVTANVRLFAKALTVFANQKAYGRLSSGQRDALKRAATDTRRYIETHLLPERELIPRLCAANIRVVLATQAELAALERASHPVYVQLEADPATKRFIEQIRAWKKTTPPDPAIGPVPASCTAARPAPAPVQGNAGAASLVNGTYRWVLALADAKAANPGQVNPGDVYPMIGTAVLKDGVWQFGGSDHDHGTYSIHGNRIRFDWVNAGSVLIFEFTRDSEGTLHLKPVLPMDPGDQFVWATKPWRRIGPPTHLPG